MGTTPNQGLKTWGAKTEHPMMGEFNTNFTKIDTALGNFSTLPTTDKTNLAGAIVEINNSLKATEDGASGANYIGATPVLTGGGNTVQSNMEAIYASVIETALGQIPNDSLTEAKMAEEMKKSVAGGVAAHNDLTALQNQVNSHQAEYVSVKNYGAKGDASVDDTAAIQAAITAAESYTYPIAVYFPAGIYCISSSLVITKPLNLIGAGMGTDENYATLQPNTTLKWINPSGGTMIKFNDSETVCIGGGGIRDMTIDCNTIAEIGLQVKGVSSASFSNLCIREYTSIGLKLMCTTNGAISFNRFYNLAVTSIQSSTQAIVMTDNANYNPCHNSFIGIRTCWDGPNTGVVVTGDNNTFYDLMCYRRPAGTGYGVSVGTGVNPANGDNIFYHVQSSPGGFHATGNSANTIFSYTRGNTEPEPVVDAGSKLTIYSYEKFTINAGVTGSNPSGISYIGGTAKNPSTSETRGIFGIGTNIGTGLEFGGGDATAVMMWLQAKQPNNGAGVFPFCINPLGGNVGIGTGTSIPTSALQVVGLPVYANNAAAIAGGLTAGAFYRTGADPDVVCVVH